jgi:hypothetical protein
MEEDTKQEEKKIPEKPLDKMTAPELREIAAEIPGVTGVHAMKKDELLSTIKEARGIKDETKPKSTRKGTTKQTRSVQEIKAKIIELKRERESARTARDNARVNLLRRRISRMKKLSRKTLKK